MDLKEYQLDRLDKINYNSRFADRGGIVFFGDSLIEGWDLNRLGIDNVYNCGISGLTTNDLLGLHNECVGNYRPDKVVILAGVNDLSEENQFDKLDIAFNMYKLIEILNLKYQVKDIYVISPLPINKEAKTSLCNNIQLKLLGEEIEKICNEFQNVKFINCFEEFSSDDDCKKELYDDAFHLNDEGYNLLSDLIKNDL